MKRALLASALVAACAAPPSGSAPPASALSGSDEQASAGDALPDPADYSRELARFQRLRIGMGEAEARDSLRTYFDSSGEMFEGVRVIRFEGRGGDGDTRTLRTRRIGMPDDSVGAEEALLIFRASALVDYGLRVICNRGDDPHAWVITPCP